MKSALLALVIAGLLPVLLHAQETDWFQKGLESTKPVEQIAFFTKSIEAGNEVAAAYYCRASARLSAGDIQGAIDDYTNCIRIDSADMDAWYSRGMAKQRVSIDYQDAVSDLAKVFENSTPQAGYIIFFNGYNFRNEDCKSVMEYYDKVLKHFQCDASICTKLGYCCLATGDYAGALEYFNKAISLQPKRIDPLLGLALLFYYQHDDINMNIMMNKAQNIRPILRNGVSGLDFLHKEGYAFRDEDQEALIAIFKK